MIGALSQLARFIAALKGIKIDVKYNFFWKKLEIAQRIAKITHKRKFKKVFMTTYECKFKTILSAFVADTAY